MAAGFALGPASGGGTIVTDPSAGAAAVTSAVFAAPLIHSVAGT
jgi:hypothetical protein